MITLIAYIAASAWFLELTWMLELNRFSAPERSAIVMVSLATLMLDVSIAILLRALDTLRKGIDSYKVIQRKYLDTTVRLYALKNEESDK